MMCSKNKNVRKLLIGSSLFLASASIAILLSREKNLFESLEISPNSKLYESAKNSRASQLSLKWRDDLNHLILEEKNKNLNFQPESWINVSKIILCASDNETLQLLHATELPFRTKSHKDKQVFANKNSDYYLDVSIFALPVIEQDVSGIIVQMDWIDPKNGNTEAELTRFYTF